jgi:alkaline phosphatase D
VNDDERYGSRRREFLRKAGAATVAAGFGGSGMGATAAEASGTRQAASQAEFGTDPFTLGIASGDPVPDAVVLWTRLAPKPLRADGGMAERRVSVNWELAADEAMTDVVASGSATATAEYAHSVHVDVTGLEPDTTYYYRFEAGSYRTTVGTTKTAPAPDADVNDFAFAFVSCQDWPKGYFTAYRHLAEEDIELVVHLGDYIYGKNIQTSLDRSHEPPHNLESLGDYRVRYAQYKTDENLQAAHAACPWIVTWDDHEVVNNYAGDDYRDVPHDEFRERRANAYRAYFEHQPLRPSRLPDGPNLPLYRRFKFGDLVEFDVLDTRQYRDDIVHSEAATDDPDRTILGDEQEDWLVTGLADSTARWNVLANQVLMSSVDISNDWWDGYEADRRTVLDAMAEHPDRNPIVITGDIHRNYAYDLKADFSNPDAPTVGTEYVGTSLTSGMNGTGITQYGRSANEPWQRFFSDHRGYVRCTVTPDRWRTDYRAVSTVKEPTASVRTLASFATDDGTPGAKLLSEPPAHEPVEIVGITRGASEQDGEGFGGNAVRLRNTGDEPVDLDGFRLSFQSGALRVPTNDEANVYTFDPRVLDPGGTVTVRIGSGEDTETVRYTGHDTDLDRAVLVADADGIVLDEAAYPPPDSGAVSIRTETPEPTTTATDTPLPTTTEATETPTERTTTDTTDVTNTVDTADTSTATETTDERPADETTTRTRQPESTATAPATTTPTATETAAPARGSHTDGESSSAGPGFGVLAALAGITGIAIHRLKRRWEENRG